MNFSASFLRLLVKRFLFPTSRKHIRRHNTSDENAKKENIEGATNLNLARQTPFSPRYFYFSWISITIQHLPIHFLIPLFFHASWIQTTHAPFNRTKRAYWHSKIFWPDYSPRWKTVCNRLVLPWGLVSMKTEFNRNLPGVDCPEDWGAAHNMIMHETT